VPHIERPAGSMTSGRQVPVAFGARARRMLSRLAEAGLRTTAQRRLLVCTIADRRSPFAPEVLVDELRPVGVGRATVYRTLERMERLGLLAHVRVGSSHGYTVCDEGHHHHLVCSSCKTVVPIDADVIETEIQRLADQFRFRLDAHTLEFEGQCATCSGDEPS
jgi:Fur family transcriptional regulator, ferric uptake regulator